MPRIEPVTEIDDLLGFRRDDRWRRKREEKIGNLQTGFGLQLCAGRFETHFLTGRIAIPNLEFEQPMLGVVLNQLGRLDLERCFRLGFNRGEHCDFALVDLLLGFLMGKQHETDPSGHKNQQHPDFEAF